MMNATAPDLLSPSGSSTGHNSSLSNMVSPELHELAADQPVSFVHDYTSSSSSTPLSNLYHDNSSNSQKQQQQQDRKIFKTEYKSKFTPFDQYVYNEASDSFVKQQQLVNPTNNFRSSPLPIGSITGSRSNQDLASHLASSSGDHFSTSNSTGEAAKLGSSSELTNGHHQQETNEPWYKEVMRRNEKANEYRFKSELGHNSPLLNFNRSDSPSCFNSSTSERHLLSPHSTETGLLTPSETGAKTADSKSQASDNKDHQKDADYKQPHFRFTPSDYRQRDHLIAHMANNNNFNLPKEERNSPAASTGNHSQARQTVAPGTGPRPIVRTSAQVRSRSQSTRRQPPVSQQKHANVHNSTTTTVSSKSHQTTPTHTKSTPTQRAPSTNRTVSGSKSAAATRTTPVSSRPTTAGGPQKSGTPVLATARRQLPASTNPTRVGASRLTNGTSSTGSTPATRSSPASSTNVASKRILTSRQTPGASSTRTRPLATSSTSTTRPSPSVPISRATPQQRSATPSSRSVDTPTSSGKSSLKSTHLSNNTSASSTPIASNNAVKSIKTPAAAAAKMENDLTAALAPAGLATAGLATAGLATAGLLAASNQVADLQETNYQSQPIYATEEDLPQHLEQQQFGNPLEEQNHLIFTTTEAGNMLADELAQAERDASIKANSEQLIINLEPEIEPESELETEQASELLDELLIDKASKLPNEPAIEPIKETVDEPAIKPNLESTSKLEDELAKESVDEPAIEPANELASESTNEPVDGIARDLVSEAAIGPSNQLADELVDKPTIQPVSEPASKPADESADEPEDELAIESASGSTNEPVDGTASELASESVIEPKFELTNELAIEPTIEPANKLANELENGRTIDSVSESINEQEVVLKSELASELAIEPANQSADEPLDKPVIQPVSESASESADEPEDELASESAIEPVNEAADEPAIKPNFEPTSKLDAEVASEVASESVDGPASILAKEPVDELASEPAGELKAEPEIDLDDKSIHETISNLEQDANINTDLNSEPIIESKAETQVYSEAEIKHDLIDIHDLKDQTNSPARQEEEENSTVLVNGLAGGLVSTEDGFDSSERDLSSNELNTRRVDENQEQIFLNLAQQVAKVEEEEEDHDEPYSLMPEKGLADNEQDSEESYDDEVETTKHEKNELLMDVADLMNGQSRLKQEMTRKAELARKDSSPISQIGPGSEVLLSPEHLANQLSHDSMFINNNNSEKEKDDKVEDEQEKVEKKDDVGDGEKVEDEDEKKKKKEEENRQENLIDITDVAASTIIGDTVKTIHDAVNQKPESRTDSESDSDPDPESGKEQQHGELHRQLNISQHERKLSSSFKPDSLRRRESTRSSSSSSPASSSASSSLERVVQGDIKSDYDELELECNK